MKLADMRNLSDAELQTKLMDAREELMNLRFQFATGALTDFTRLRYARRNVARFLTVISEREHVAMMEGEQ